MFQSIAMAIVDRHEECERAIEELSQEVVAPPHAIRKAQRDFGEELADALLHIAKLQPRAREKFGDGVWWVTDRALQQATAWQVAAYKAQWFKDQPAFDLCCGIGGDTMQMARRGHVVGIDLDPALVAMAKANLRKVRNGDQGSLLCDDVTSKRLPRDSAFHIDPDRRAAETRTSQPEFSNPTWKEVLTMIETADGAVVKLAPAARLTAAESEPHHRCWISLSGSVREQSLLCGSVIENAGLGAGRRSAVRIGADGSCCRFAPSEELHAEEAVLPQDYLIDPDPAIRAAALTEPFAARFGLAMLAGPPGFLTGWDIDVPAVRDLATVHQVIWHGQADDKKIRAQLRERDLFPVTIKARGIDVDPAALKRRYRKCGSKATTLWIGRAGDRGFASITEPAEETSA